MMDDHQALVRRWWQDYAERALEPDKVDAFVTRLDSDILADVPELLDEPDTVEQLHASSRAHWRNFLVGLFDDFRLALPPSAVALVVSLARRNVDLDVVLKVYRVGGRSIFRFLSRPDQLTGLPSGLPREEALSETWLRVDRWISESVDEITACYNRERTEIRAGAERRRTETVDALLAGSAPTVDAERALGHRLSGWQTAFILSASPAGPGGTSLSDTGRQFCRLLGLPSPLTVPSGSAEL